MKNYTLKTKYETNFFEEGRKYTLKYEVYQTDLNEFLEDWKKEYELSDEELEEEDFVDFGEKFVIDIKVAIYKGKKKIIVIELSNFDFRALKEYTSSVLGSLDEFSADYYKMLAILRDDGFDYENDPLNQPSLYYIKDYTIEDNTDRELVIDLFKTVLYECETLEFLTSNDCVNILYAYFLNIPERSQGKYLYQPTLEEQMGMILGEKIRGAAVARAFGNNDKADEMESELVFDDLETGLKEVVMSDRQKEYYINQTLDHNYEKLYPDEAFDSEELEFMKRIGFYRIKGTQLMIQRGIPFLRCGSLDDEDELQDIE